MNNEMQLRWSDAWLLLAVYYAKDRARACLSAIIAAADYINHAVMNYEELASGLIRLEHAGLITVASDLSRFTCLAKALGMIEPIVHRINTAHEVRREIEREINATPWNPKEPIPHPANNLTFPGLTKEIYKSAVDEYLKTMKSQR
jgi:hypothetical protein